MKTRYFALVFGLLFLIAGILGFIPSLLTSAPSEGPPMAVNSFYGYLFGMFPVNLVHNLVNMALGLWGLAAWRDFPMSRIFARSAAVIFVVLAVLGLIPELDTLYGIVPLYSNDVWLHAVSAIVAAYFGWAPVAAVTTAGEPMSGIRR